MLEGTLVFTLNDFSVTNPVDTTSPITANKRGKRRVVGDRRIARISMRDVDESNKPSNATDTL